MTEMTSSSLSRGRRIAFYAPITLFSLLLITFSAIMVPILPSLVIGWFVPDLFGAHQLHEMVSGAISWLVLAGILVQLRQPERKVAGMQMALLVIIVSTIVSLIAGTFFAPSLLFLLFLVLAAAFHPRREEMLRFSPPYNRELLALVAVAAVPAFLYALDQLNLQQMAVAADEHAQFGHYAVMASAVITTILVGLLAGLRTKGWRIAGWGAGFVAVAFGLTSVVFPGQISSVGTLWGVLAVVWGVVFIGIAEWTQRRKSER
jgi:MFS family permease